MLLIDGLNYKDPINTQNKIHKRKYGFDKISPLSKNITTTYALEMFKYPLIKFKWHATW